MSKIYYSIIIPHKNIPDLLERCLNSIPIREDVQVIIVDDNSDPAVVDFEHFPGSNRSDVEIVFTKESKGAGYARNIGIEHSVGEWLLFIDADDFLTYPANQIFDDYKCCKNDVVYFNACSLDSEYYTNSWRTTHVNNAHQMQDNNPDKDFFFRYKFGEPWCKFVKRKLIVDHNISCEETIIHNDTQLSYLIGYYAKEISFDSRAIYCVTSRQQSVSKQISDECYYTRLAVFFKKYRFLKDNGIFLFEDSFICPVFINMINQDDSQSLSRCYQIAYKFGISSREINKRIKIFRKSQRAKGRLNHIHSLLDKTLSCNTNKERTAIK